MSSVCSAGGPGSSSIWAVFGSNWTKVIAYKLNVVSTLSLFSRRRGVRSYLIRLRVLFLVFTLATVFFFGVWSLIISSRKVSSSEKDSHSASSSADASGEVTGRRVLGSVVVRVRSVLPNYLSFNLWNFLGISVWLHFPGIFGGLSGVGSPVNNGHKCLPSFTNWWSRAVWEVLCHGFLSRVPEHTFSGAAGFLVFLQSQTLDVRMIGRQPNFYFLPSSPNKTFILFIKQN